MVRAALLLCFMSGCYYDVDDDADIGVLDMRAPAVDLDVDAGICANGSPEAHSGELAEAESDGQSGWGAQSIPDDGTTHATVMLDTTHVAAGDASLRLDATGASAGLFYPSTRDASFDLSDQLYISFSVTADDSSTKNDPGWQGGQPHLLIVTTTDDYYEYFPANNLLPRTPGDFVNATVPLAGGSNWTRNTTGAPDLRHVSYIAWTFTTWGAGFTVWLDDVQIGPEPFLDCP